MDDVGIFFGPLVYVMVIWYIFSVLVCCTEENLATLVEASPSKVAAFVHFLLTELWPL
jgi:hypothetical protein